MSGNTRPAGDRETFPDASAAELTGAVHPIAAESWAKWRFTVRQ